MNPPTPLAWSWTGWLVGAVVAGFSSYLALVLLLAGFQAHDALSVAVVEDGSLTIVALITASAFLLAISDRLARRRADAPREMLIWAGVLSGLPVLAVALITVAAAAWMGELADVPVSLIARMAADMLWRVALMWVMLAASAAAGAMVFLNVAAASAGRRV